MIRVIAHVDMDCFYCQVEHKRLGIPPTTPLAVQQWNMMIAVNYAARPFGIKRGMKAEECRKRCPGIQLVCMLRFWIIITVQAALHCLQRRLLVSPVLQVLAPAPAPVRSQVHGPTRMAKHVSGVMCRRRVWSGIEELAKKSWPCSADTFLCVSVRRSTKLILI
jgi:hypothetical protein